MGVWNEATPAGSDTLSEGDDRIRELKDAIEEALSHEDSTFPGATPESTPIFIPGMKTGTTGLRPTGDSLVTGRFYANTTLNILERYNGSTWDSVGTNFPSGTKMAWYQDAPPVGWTAIAVNDKFLRVVNSGGTGGTTGGSVAASTSLAHTHGELTHTHTISSQAGHTHTLTGTLALSINTSAATLSKTLLTTSASHDHTGTTGAGSLTLESQLGAFAYADIVLATKD